ncbi:MAG: WYL domain-containing protein [Aggregatilineales bacterium]
MPRTEKTRQARIERTLMTVRAHPDGLTEAELADLLDLNRRTVNNYLRDLELQGQLYREGTLWFAVRSSSMRLRPLDLTPEEAATLYLATRLFVKQIDKRNEPAENALYKLAEALTADIGVGDEIRQAAQELAARQMDPGYSKVFGAVVRGYLYRRAVEIVYAPRKGRPFQTTVHPYLLEPSAIGYTTYIIGYSSQPDALRTYKLERVREARLTGESYSIPPDFPGLEILRHSWSIMLGEELVEVVLRFHPSVVDRVNETRWHPSERKEADPDRFGWLRWTAQVTDTTDMLPWIRGWGADVEVLAPEELRIEMMGEARRIAERYGWETSKAEQSVSNADDLTATFRIYSGDE